MALINLYEKVNKGYVLQILIKCLHDDDMISSPSWALYFTKANNAYTLST